MIDKFRDCWPKKSWKKLEWIKFSESNKKKGGTALSIHHEPEKRESMQFGFDSE